MPTFRRPKDYENPFTRVSNDVVNDDRISYKAKGLLLYILSKVDTWEVYQRQLAEVGPDGVSAVRSGLEELMEAGYVERRTKRDDDSGTFAGVEYVVHEHPDTEMRFSHSGDSDSGSSQTGKPPTNNNRQQQQRKKETTEGAAPAHEDPKGVGDLVAPDDAVEIHDHFFPGVRLSIWQKETLRHKVDDLATFYEVAEYWMLNDYRGRSVGKMIQMYHEKKTEEKSGPAALTEEQKRDPDWTINDDGERCFKGVPVSQLGPNATPTDA